MSKFGGQDWILVLQEHKGAGEGFYDSLVSKRTITTSATRYAEAGNIPKSRRFSSRAADTHFDPFLASFSPLEGSCLGGITRLDKLLIFAHGSDTGIAWMADGDDNAALGGNALALTRLLRKHGLDEVGLITFKACFVGRANFLSTFAYALDASGIKAGWLKGYKGLSDTDTSTGKPREIIRGDDKKKLLEQNMVSTANGIDTDRYKIIRGPGKLLQDVNVGRYDGAKSSNLFKGQTAIDLALGKERKRYAVDIDAAIDD